MKQTSHLSTKRETLLNPTLILIVGIAGSGKTTLAKGILSKLQATYLDNNFIADAFFPLTRNNQEYLAMRPSFYKILYRITEENLIAGNSVILDVPHVKEMLDPKWRLFLDNLLIRTNAKLAIIRCSCLENMLKKRIALRGEERDKWKLENWDEFKKSQPIEFAIPFDHLDIDSANDINSNIDLSIKYIHGRLYDYGITNFENS